MSESQARIAQRERERREAAEERKATIEVAPLLAALLLSRSNGGDPRLISDRAIALWCAFGLLEESAAIYDEFQAEAKP